MKIAILYSGLTNTNQYILNTHQKYVLDLYSNVDIYISTYTLDSASMDLVSKTLSPVVLHEDTIDDIESVVATKLIKLICKIDNIRPINALCMYYKWQQLINMVKHKYDIIIRSRLDIGYVQPLHIISNNSLNVPMGGDHLGGLMDLFAYGNYDIMKTYHTLYSFIDNYSMLEFHPETWLRHHIKSNNIGISRFKFPILLRNQVFTDTAPTFY